MFASNENELITELLTKDEGISAIDFKSKAYHLHNDHYKASFLSERFVWASSF